MTFGKKLGLCLGASFALAATIGASTAVYLSRLGNEVDFAVRKAGRKMEIVNDLRSNILGFRFAERGILLFSQAHGQAAVETNKQAFRLAAEQVGLATRNLRELVDTERGRALLDEIDTAMADYVRTQARVPELCAAGRIQDAMQLDMEQLVPIGARATKAILELTEAQHELNEAAVKRTESVLREARITLIIILLLYVCVSGLAAAVTLRSTQVLRRVAGSLTTSSAQVESAAGQMSATSQALAQGASEQAASLEETSASSEEITSMTEKNAESARSAAGLMTQTSLVVKEANESIAQMETSMREINASSDKIGKIIRVIDEIAFQTNILALNAAVEAARAGEAGMGFAVVADEVRNLAQRSAQAAKDTAGMIEESISKSNEGREKVEHVSSAIRSITESAEKVGALVDEVKLGSEEQARGIEQIAKALSQMEQVTQKSAASAEEAASVGQEMSSQATTLNQVVEDLNAMVGAGD